MTWSHRRTLVVALALLLTGLVVAVALLRSPGRGLPAGTAFHSVGTVRIGIATGPDPPRTGENAMTIVVRDAQDRPIRGAHLQVVVSMPAMGAMPYMESRAQLRETEPGSYRGEYGISMGGDWDVSVRVTPSEGAPIQAAFRLSTNMRGLAFVGGTPGGSALPPGGTQAGMADETDAISMDPARRQALGIRVAPVTVRTLSATVRASGQVAYDEARQSDVSLRFGGWIRELRADYTGRPVRRGEVLFTVYSPELWAAQQEFLDAERAARAGSPNAEAVSSAHDLARAARQRLRLWDIAEVDLEALARRDRPFEAVPVRAPSSGVITEKAVVQGSPFQAGQVLLRVARLDRVWVVASVHQMDLPLLRAGASARLSDPNRDAPGLAGRVAFVSPGLDSMTRTASVRIDVANPGGRLLPGMFMNVEISSPSSPRLAVPESAVLPTGERHVVFVDLKDGRLAPREVRLGRRAEGYYEVLAGLEAGELVVTSGNFLVAAESRLRSATSKW